MHFLRKQRLFIFVDILSSTGRLGDMRRQPHDLALRRARKASTAS